MKEIAKLIVVLTVICAVSGSLMALVNDLTKEHIRRANDAAKLQAMESVLPEFDNNPVEDAIIIKADNAEWEFFIAKKEGLFQGAAYVSTSHEGYGGDINVMVGVNSERKIQSIEILSPLKETPGLGANITQYKFKKGIIGKSISDTKWKVKKDGGEIIHITAATISSRAVVNAVKQGLDIFIANEEELTK